MAYAFATPAPVLDASGTLTPLMPATGEPDPDAEPDPEFHDPDPAPPVTAATEAEDVHDDQAADAALGVPVVVARGVAGVGSTVTVTSLGIGIVKVTVLGPSPQPAVQTAVVA